MSIYGNPVMLGGSGGTQSVDWNEPLTSNWDYAHVVNTRGQTHYANSGYGDGVINGYYLYQAVIDIISGGLQLSRYTSGTMGWLIQRFNTTVTQKIIGKTITASVLIDGQIYSLTATPTSATGGIGTVKQMGTTVGCTMTMQSGPELEINLPVGADAGSVLVKGIKIEFGNTQTLAKLENGIWVLSKDQNADMEAIKGPLFLKTW